MGGLLISLVRMTIVLHFSAFMPFKIRIAFNCRSLVFNFDGSGTGGINYRYGFMMIIITINIIVNSNNKVPLN